MPLTVMVFLYLGAFIAALAFYNFVLKGRVAP